MLPETQILIGFKGPGKSFEMIVPHREVKGTIQEYGKKGWRVAYSTVAGGKYKERLQRERSKLIFGKPEPLKLGEYREVRGEKGELVGYEVMTEKGGMSVPGKEWETWKKQYQPIKKEPLKPFGTPELFQRMESEQRMRKAGFYPEGYVGEIETPFGKVYGKMERGILRPVVKPKPITISGLEKTTVTTRPQLGVLPSLDFAQRQVSQATIRGTATLATAPSTLSQSIQYMDKNLEVKVKKVYESVTGGQKAQLHATTFLSPKGWWYAFSYVPGGRKPKEIVLERMKEMARREHERKREELIKKGIIKPAEIKSIEEPSLIALEGIKPQEFKEPSKPSFLERIFHAFVPFPEYKKPWLYREEEKRIYRTVTPTTSPFKTTTVTTLKTTTRTTTDMFTTRIKTTVPILQTVTAVTRRAITKTTPSHETIVKTMPVLATITKTTPGYKTITPVEKLKTTTRVSDILEVPWKRSEDLFKIWEQRQEWVKVPSPFLPSGTPTIAPTPQQWILMKPRKELKEIVEMKKAAPYFGLGLYVGLGAGAVAGTLAGVSAVSTGVTAKAASIATFGLKAAGAAGTVLYTGQLIKEKRLPTSEEMGLISGGIIGGYVGYSVFKPKVTTQTQVQRFMETEWEKARKYGYAKGKIWVKIKSPVLKKDYEFDVSSIWKSKKTERPSVFTRMYSYLRSENKALDKTLAYSESEALAGIHYKGPGFMISEKVPSPKFVTTFTEGKVLPKSTMKIIDYSAQAWTKYLGEQPWYWKPGMTKYYATIGGMMIKKEPSKFVGLTKVFKPGKEIPFIKGTPKPMKPFIDYKTSLDATAKIIGQSVKSIDATSKVSDISKTITSITTTPFVFRKSKIEREVKETGYPSGPEYPRGWMKLSEFWAGKKRREREEYEYIVSPATFKGIMTGERLGSRIIFKETFKPIIGQVQPTTMIERIGIKRVTVPSIEMRQVQGQMQSQLQRQRQMQKQLQRTVTRTGLNIPTPIPFLPPIDIFRLRPSPYHLRKGVSTGFRRILKQSKRASKFLPTSSLFNIEKTVRKYGKWSLPRGRIPERMFWKGFKMKGVFMEFPTQQQLKSILGGGKPMAKRKKRRKKKR